MEIIAQSKELQVKFGSLRSIHIGGLYQYDKGQELVFAEAFPVGTEVQFDAQFSSETINRQITSGRVRIPDVCLEYPGIFTAYIKQIDAESETTVKRIKFAVLPREKPEDYVTEEDEPSFRSWVQSQVSGIIQGLSDREKTLLLELLGNADTEQREQAYAELSTLWGKTVETIQAILDVAKLGKMHLE